MKSDERYRQLFERNLAGLYRSTADGRILDCNETFAKMYGYASCEEILSVDAIELYFSARERKAFLEKLKDNGVLVNHELRGKRKDGSAFWLLENVTLDRSRDPWIVEGTMLDITDRKEAEEELEKSRAELRTLSLRLSAAREEERSRIAREIHDELGQKLTVLKMAVARLRRSLPRDPESLQSSARGILASLDELLRTVRDLSTELRPAVLDHLELVDALKWQARDFESRTGIRCRLVSRVDGVMVDPGCKTDLYRVTQEALTNVVRHTGASRVQIQISREAGDLLLEISDNGQGITEGDLNRQNSLGLLGIRERIQALGGTVRLKNATEGGAKLRIRIPLEREAQ
ncbi:MAG: PAS domain-containing sensor histidine kinase [Acidobacteriota bacterium]|nr:PAS domain-containing sensor histidine kinase [Acidobacteriota bacterium]MDQ5871188.1 PAS domain-containing sensor histidine kinase [Acidobacteriota bacterium]